MAWQSGVWEAADETCWTTTLALNERHLKRLLSEYVRYHHEDRTHLGLEKGTPDCRIRSAASGRVLSQERLGGLHHRYNRAA
jgi:putative transposase